MTPVALVLVAMCLSSGAVSPGRQAPERDGEIRSAYLDLEDATQVWLTLEPRSADGKAAPPGVMLTFTWRFPGKRPSARPPDIEVRANVGLLWAPRQELWLALDGDDKIDLAPQVPPAAMNGNGGWTYVTSTIDVATLERAAGAKRVAGSVLGFAFEFTDAQRDAMRKFVERITSTSPPSPHPACAP